MIAGAGADPDRDLRAALRDPVTDLPSRPLFADRLERALRLARSNGGIVGVLSCDLDGFKAINSSLGHAAGDDLLRAVAGRLRATVRAVDTVTRVGGDEFAVLLDGLEDAEEAARTAQRILTALEPPFTLDGREVFVGASIGIATGLGETGAMVRDAGLAMDRAKSEGKGRYALFEPHLHTAVVERLELESELKGAIARDELYLDYQPVFNLRSGEIAGLEALVRWRHPTQGIVPPDRFIPLAEENGEIHELGRWVLREACRQGALWRARYPGFTQLQIGVNISAAQLLDRGIVDEVSMALEASQLDPAGLTIEITETVLASDTKLVAQRLAQLKELGVDLAIDDFGRGYSSLVYLHRFAMDNLKIDREFVAAARTEEDPKVLRAIVDLAAIFGLRPIAEGIERPEEIEQLLALGCELGQGHLLSKPLSATEADALLLRVGLLGATTAPGGSLGSRGDEDLEGSEGDPRRLTGDPRRGGSGAEGGG